MPASPALLHACFRHRCCSHPHNGRSSACAALIPGQDRRAGYSITAGKEDRRARLGTRSGPRQVPPVVLRTGHTCVCFCFTVSHRGLLSYFRVSRLALHSASAKLIWPLLTSGDSSQRLTTPVALWQNTRSPRVLRTHFHAYACRIYVTAFRASFGLRRYSPSCPAVPPRIRFLFVRPALCLRLPPDS